MLRSCIQRRLLSATLLYAMRLLGYPQHPACIASRSAAGARVIYFGTPRLPHLLQLFTAHYPERLGVMICLDMGMMVEMAFGGVCSQC